MPSITGNDSSDFSTKISIRLDAPPTSPVWLEPVSLAAFGDLMLTGEWDEVAESGGAEEAFKDLAAVCARDDLVFANLEVTVEGGNGLIVKEPRLIGKPSTLVATLEAIGVDLVCLANNHAFDANLAGFLKVRGLLEELGVLHLGAGCDAVEAARPLLVERRGVRFGWLAYTADDTKPSHVARDRGFGVNPLREGVALREIEELREEVDHVLVSLHWGVEYCHLPSPEQVQLARRLVDQGASLVLGHHAHVIQGVEAYRGGVIAFNLGNATTTDLIVRGRRAIRQTRRTRSSFVLRAAFTRKRLEAVELVPIRAPRGRVLVGDRTARRIVEKANRRLAAGVSPRRWKATRLYEDVVLRTARKLDPRVIRSVRPRHLGTFFKNLSRALQGRGPA